MMNRKLRKLIKSPRLFFKDMHALQPLWKALGWEGRIDPTRRNKMSKPDDASQVVANEALESPVPGLDRFELIGENWLDPKAEQLPIALLWGFMPWKRDFMARYLREYRTAFSRNPNAVGLEAVYRTQRDVVVVFWGKKEFPEVEAFCHKHRIQILRVEDGFIRSTELGSAHITPLSLAIDKTGIYFDSNSPSDLELILNQYDFSSNSALLKSADQLMDVHKLLKISKYNSGAFRSAFYALGPKLKRRILVIGQVEGDASLEHGMAKGWTCRKLIETAIAENPGAEIIYRPHPDVLQGFRTNSSELKELQKICYVLLNEVMLADLFAVVDHVYTITSLAGMEALIHGLPVTVMGAPFYAGWGLTDDRQIVARRGRSLTLSELFCGAYLLYPKYLTDLDDPVAGCLAAMIRIVGERKQALNAQIAEPLIERRAGWIAASPSWPALFRPTFFPALVEKYGKKLFSVIDIPYMYAQCHGEFYRRALSYFLLGKLVGTAAYGKFLNELRPRLQISSFAEIIQALWQIQPNATLLDQWAYYCERAGDYGEARDALNHLSFKSEYKKNEESELPFSPKRVTYILRLAQFELRQKNFSRAEALFNQLLLSNHVQAEIFTGLAEIARLKFDFESGAAILAMYNEYDPTWKLGRAHLQLAQTAAFTKNRFVAIQSIAMTALINPQSAESVAVATGALSAEFDMLPFANAVIAAIELDGAGSVLSRAKSLIAHERPEAAEQILLGYTPTPIEIAKYCVMLSLAYSYQGKLTQAKKLIKEVIAKINSPLIYQEGLRLSIISDDYVWGKSLLDEAELRNIELSDIYLRKISMGLGDIKKGYLSFRKIKSNRTLKAYLGDKCAQSIHEMSSTPGAKNVVIAFFGPGDEIRFASLYRKMQRACGDNPLIFTCDPRLHSMLSRFYVDLTFVPTERIRSLARLANYDNHSALPGSDLHVFFDNIGWQLVKGADKVILSTDALGDFIEGYESFDGTPYLVPDPAKTAQWEARLISHRRNMLVGLSWRSSLTTYSRNEHYLSIEDIVPLLEVEGVQFVNLQYDNCTEELEWVEQHYPGKIVNFSDLDQYNDLEGVGALMKALDVVISPATTVAELAGALGCRTLLLSNSSELTWRKRPGGNQDAWHGSMEIIEGEALGDKKLLVQATVRRLREIIQENSAFKFSLGKIA